MKVAVPRAQHSPRFGQAAEKQTVWRRFSRHGRCTASKAGVMRTRTLSQGGCRRAEGTRGSRGLGTRLTARHECAAKAARHRRAGALDQSAAGGRRAELARQRARSPRRASPQGTIGAEVRRDRGSRSARSRGSSPSRAARRRSRRACAAGRGAAAKTPVVPGARVAPRRRARAIAAIRSASMPRRKRCTSAAPRAARSTIEVADELARARGRSTLAAARRPRAPRCRAPRARRGARAGGPDRERRPSVITGGCSSRSSVIAAGARAARLERARCCALQRLAASAIRPSHSIWSGPGHGLEVELGLLEQLADAVQEAVGRGAVDGAVIVGERQVHDRADHDRVLAVERRAPPGASRSRPCAGCRPAAG